MRIIKIRRKIAKLLDPKTYAETSILRERVTKAQKKQKTAQNNLKRLELSAGRERTAVASRLTPCCGSSKKS